MKRKDEFDVDQFSKSKLQENKNTINNLMNRAREFQCEINYMHDSKDFKDAESMHSGPVNQRYVFSKMIEEDCWAAPKLCRLWDTHFTSGDVFASPLAYPSSS